MEEMLGGTRITYLGHSTFRFVTAGDEQIIIDPFLTNNPHTPEDLKQVGELDTILITHGHFDHFDDVESLAGQTGATDGLQLRDHVLPAGPGRRERRSRS